MKNNTSLLKGKAIHFCLLLVFFAHCCFNNTVNGQGTTTISASISLQSGYSNFFTSTPPLLSACYDHYQLNLDGIVLSPGCSLNVYVPQGVSQISFPTFTQTSILSVEVVQQTIPPFANYINLVNSSSTQTLSSLSLDINFDFDLCETSNEINMPLDFQLILCAQSFTLVGDPAQAGFLNVDNSDPAKKVLTINVNRQTISLNTISSLASQIPFNTIPNISIISSKVGEYATYGDILERYYFINPESGISDYFTLTMEVENDLEILGIEAIKAIGGN